MSNFYLDVIKDRLYVEKANSKERRAAQTAMYMILDGMTRLISPILAYTSDEIWQAMKHDASADAEHVVLNQMPEPTGDVYKRQVLAHLWSCSCFTFSFFCFFFADDSLRSESVQKIT